MSIALRSFADNLLSLLFPERCVSCHRFGPLFSRRNISIRLILTHMEQKIAMQQDVFRLYHMLLRISRRNNYIMSI